MSMTLPPLLAAFWAPNCKVLSRIAENKKLGNLAEEVFSFNSN